MGGQGDGGRGGVGVGVVKMQNKQQQLLNLFTKSVKTLLEIDVNRVMLH